MKIKALFTMTLCALLAAAAVSCGMGDPSDLPSANAPQDSTVTSGVENTPETDPTQESMEDTSDDVQTETSTEISTAPLCEHIFEDSICTLCGSDITALFLFLKHTSLASGESYTIYGTQGILPSVLVIPVLS